MSTSDKSHTQTSAPDNATFPRNELDVTKLHALPSEQQELYLLTFTADLVQSTAKLSKDELVSQQRFLTQELFKIVKLSSPAPSRIIRNNIGRCFAIIFSKGNRTDVYDTVMDLLGILQAGKSEFDLKTKFAAVVALGEIFATVGESISGKANAVCSALHKLLKQAQYHAGLRSSIFIVFKKVAGGIGSPLDENTARDVWKQARNAAVSDKAITVQASACLCLEQLIKTTNYFANANDFEHLKSTIWKAIDSPSPAVRHAAASCLATTLVKSYSASGLDPVPTIRRPKKQAKKQTPTAATQEDESPERPQTPSGKKAELTLSFKLSDILTQLSSQYCRTSTTNRARAGIAVCYKLVARGLGSKVAEEKYSEIAGHLLTTLLNHPTITHNRYRLLTTRKYVKHILEDTVGQELLGEMSRLNAAKYLINSILKDYPQVLEERPEPSKHTLTGAVSALSSIISSLGSAISSLADGCREALLQVIQHPSYTVQIYVAHCMRNFVLACPHYLLTCVTVCMNSLNREIGQLSTPRQSTKRCLGFAHGLASMLSTSRLQPLYGSVDVYSRVLSQATELLKTSSNSELRIASTQIQVAWILIGGLMPLGPSFTKIHLPQLLLLWKNALPKPLPKDNLAQRGPLEISFLAHVRECALGSILAFLEFNSKLITADGARRIATMLQNTVAFLNTLPRLKSAEDISQRLSPSLQLVDYTTMVRRRVLQCFAKLVALNHPNLPDILSSSNVLGLAISSFADPDVVSANPLETSIAGSPANFESLWDLDDNFGFGVTGLAKEFANQAFSGRRYGHSPWSSYESTDQAIDDALMSPLCQAREHDSVLLYSSKEQDCATLPDPPSTGVVNAAINLFSVTLPLQTPKVQEGSVEQIATLLSTQSLNRNPGRKAAMTVNIAVALLHTLRVATRETAFAPGNMKHVATEKIIQELLQKFITDPDPLVRMIAFEAVGRLCNSSGNAFTNTQINNLVDIVVENRDPNARAGCAAALGCIHAQVGGMAAGFHLKTIIGVLMSLCNDSHPVVHFWALEGLRRVVDSAGLTFSAYVSSTLGMLARLYVADTHNDEAASISTSNLEATYSTPLAISRCVDALINVIGPDLRDIAKTRELVFTLVKEFQLESDTSMVAESSKCLDHLSLYAPSHVDFSAYVHWLQQTLASDNVYMREAAVRGLNNLMKRDADRVIRTAFPTFEDELWTAFDNIPDSRPLQNIVRNWLQQTGLTDTATWVQRLQRVFSKTRPKKEEVTTPATAAPPTIAPEIPDDEVAGFATTVTDEKTEPVDDSTVGQELLRWQTRSFAMSCLSELLSIVNNEILPDQTIPAEEALQDKVGDIVRMAFSASTANVVELRVWGLKILDQVLKMFGKTPDPDFSEASLLEQYQAQIGSALTPAFATDSSPELASEAINVCGTFVGTGIVTNVDRMGRIFKLLVVGLENFARNPDTTEIGDLRGLNSNARVMIKLALYSAWARLQIASDEQKYLVPIVQPYTAMLTPLWLSSLQEYARLRFEPEISSTIGPGLVSDNLDDVYAALNRETLLKFYQDSWLNLVDAIASLVEKDSDFVFDALDGKTKVSTENGKEQDETQVNGDGVASKNQINYREEPVAFFFVLFGLVFEALVSQSNAPQSQTLEVLQALRKILHPSVAGNAVYQDAVFSETIDTLDRLVMTKGHGIQTVIVEIARNLSLHHQSATRGESQTEHLSDDIEQLFELARNIILVLAGILPNLGESSPNSRLNISDEAITLIRLAFSSLVDVTSVFPSIIRADLHACILHIFITMLSTGVCQAEVVPQALPTFRRFIQNITRPTDSSHSGLSDDEILSQQIRTCVSRLLSILTIAQRRESNTSLPCAKNTLLSLAILLTASSHIIPPQDPLIPQVLNEMLDCLQDLGLATVTAGCIRSLLLNPAPRSATDDAIARFLFPRLIAFITGLPRGSEGEGAPTDPENVKSTITHTLVCCVGSATIPPEATPSALSLLVSALLARGKREGAAVYNEIAARLLELAKVDAATFRGLVATMDEETRALTEEILRGAGGGGQEGARDAAVEQQSAPSIALRMDF
ncbi:hypothetical protein VTO42DRAFT_206 [Malbranchea cinnamomea]